MKRKICLILSLLLVAAMLLPMLVSCGDTPDGKTEETSSELPSETPSEEITEKSTEKETEKATEKEEVTTEAVTEVTEPESVSVNMKNGKWFVLISDTANNIEMYAARLIVEKIVALGGDAEKVTSLPDGAENVIHIGKPEKEIADNEYFIYGDKDMKKIEILGGELSVMKAAREFIALLDENGSAEVLLNDPETAVNANAFKVEKPVYPKCELLDGKRICALCDQKNAPVVMIDVDAEDPRSADALIMEWQPTKELGFKSFSSSYAYRIDDAKVRYCEAIDKYVLITTSSSGYISVAELETGKCLWYVSMPGYGPHSIELLPNGYLAVALSGNGDNSLSFLYVFDFVGAVTNDKKTGKPVFTIPMSSTHGVAWDDNNDVLWCLDNVKIVAFEFVKNGDEVTLVKIDEMSRALPVSGGHDLSVDYSDPNCFWITCSKVYHFSKSTGSFAIDYNGVEVINSNNAKSIGEYADGMILRAVALNKKEYTAAHDTYILDVFTTDEQGKVTKKEVKFDGSGNTVERHFYKARVISPYYS